MKVNCLPQLVQQQAMYLFKSNLSNSLLFGKKEHCGKGVVGSMISYCRSRYGDFDEKHFRDVVRRGFHSKYYFYYNKEEQA